jgi:serine phosphatase RsbU (regulator of sigma subunit)
VPINRGDVVMVVSDGIIEQFGIISAAAGPSRTQFEVEGVRKSMSQTSGDEVAELFKAVIEHAGTEHLSDDATAVLIRWG